MMLSYLSQRIIRIVNLETQLAKRGPNRLIEDCLGWFWGEGCSWIEAAAALKKKMKKAVVWMLDVRDSTARALASNAKKP